MVEVIRRGEIWVANLNPPRGQEVGKIRPVLVFQDNALTAIGTPMIIILPMTTGKSGSVIAERIRTEFKKETFPHGPDNNIHMTASIGIAQYKVFEDMKSFVNRVDQLKYQAWKNGKDRVCFES